MSQSQHHGRPHTDEPRTSPADNPVLPSATVIGFDGTVLATISRHTEPSGDAATTVVDAVGDIDADTAPLLGAALTSAVNGNARVCCDLTRVPFFSAAGVAVLLAAVRQADEAGCLLTVRGAAGITAQIFAITGVDAVLGHGRETAIEG